MPTERARCVGTRNCADRRNWCGLASRSLESAREAGIGKVAGVESGAEADSFRAEMKSYRGPALPQE